MPRKTYKKRTYKKRSYKRYYKRKYKRYYKRKYYKPIKKPEIHIIEDTSTAQFNSTGGVGAFNNLTRISQVQQEGQYDNLVYTLNGKSIEGKKVRLKYLYIKGYIQISSSSDADDFNCKLMVFRHKRNTSNTAINWELLLNNSPSGAPSTWTDEQRLQMLYMNDWRNDIKINIYKKVKNLYRKYDDANNIIPFKIRIPLYDCVLTCDCYKNTTDTYYYASPHPSTNGIYFTFLSNKYDANTTISWKYKLYYTDY